MATGFFLHNNELVCDGVSVSEIAGAEGTPVYIYSAVAIRDRYREIDLAFADYPHAFVPTRPGLGVNINEKEAAKYPFKPEAEQRYFHPDGAVADW